MMKKAVLILSLLTTIIFNISAATTVPVYSSKPVNFYGGPNQRIVGFSKNKINTVADKIQPIGGSSQGAGSGSDTINGTGGTVQFILSNDKIEATTEPFYFYWKLYTPEPTTITIKKISKLKKTNAQPGDAEIDWKNNTVIGNEQLSTTRPDIDNLNIVLYEGGRLQKPVAGCREFKFVIDESALGQIKAGSNLEYTGTMVIQVTGN